MAIVEPSAVGKVRGKLGNLIVYEVNGELRMRTRPGSYKKSKSESQKAQKGRFKGTVAFYWKLDGPMLFGWDVAAKSTRGSGYNLFIRENIRNFTGEGQLADVGKLVVCYGELEVEGVGFEAEEVAPGKVRVRWDGRGKSYEECLQRLQVVVYDPARGKRRKKEIYWLEGAEGERKRGECVFELPEERGDEVHVYVYFQDVYQGLYSKSCYIGTFRR